MQDAGYAVPMPSESRPNAPALHLQPARHARQERALARVARMERSAQWDAGRFRNAGASLQMGLSDNLNVMREYLAQKAPRTPPGPLPLLSPLQGWAEPARTGLRATWLGHSTVLLELDGARLLTDPVWALRASPFQFLGPRRFHPPPVALSQLGHLDGILVSHDHYDHLDADAVSTLARLTDAPFFTALGVGDHLERFGVPHARIHELDWWETVDIPRTSVRITAAPAQHFSGRGATDRNRTLWGSYVFSGPRHRVFFSGDTGLEPQFASIRQKLGPFDLIMLEVGAFHPTWGQIHLGPWQAMEAHAQLGGAPLLPVHWSTFDLALHAWDEPILPLHTAAQEKMLPLLAPRLGQPLHVLHEEEVRKQVGSLDAWWSGVR